jgi:hypothetical protein
MATFDPTSGIGFRGTYNLPPIFGSSNMSATIPKAGKWMGQLGAIFPTPGAGASPAGLTPVAAAQAVPGVS